MTERPVEAKSEFGRVANSDKGWQAFEAPGGTIQIKPVADIREHAGHDDCWCNPSWDDGVWVHHSADKRELSETGA